MAFWTRDLIRVYTRKDWDALPPRTALAPLGSLRTIVLHHGGPVGGPRMTFREAAQTCRDWQRYHQNSNGWADIGYHFLIDGRGRMYQGRPPHRLGAHVLGQNTGRIGINFMQDGRTYGLTTRQRRTLRKLYRRKHGSLGLPAFKDLANRPGDFAVLGHRDVPGQSTECPGDRLDADFKRILREFT